MYRKLRVGFVLVALTLATILWPSAAHAQRYGHVRGGAVFVGGYFYDPFFGLYPWWSPAAYAYPYYPVYDNRADVRVMVTPKEAEVYVDGYYAGVVDDFDGTFQRLPLSPGAHELAVHLESYRTVHQRIYLTPGSTYKLRYTMERLGPGEVAEPAPSVPPVPPPPPGTAHEPRMGPRGAYGPPPQDGQGPQGQQGPRGMEPPPPDRGGPTPGEPISGYGSLAIRVQPGDADIAIDGEPWSTSGAGDRITVSLSAGSHRVEIRKSGYRPFSMDVQIRPNDTTPLNVVLSSENRQ